MECKLYLSDAFGWQTDPTSKVAIAQLRDESKISQDKCPEAQLIKNRSVRWQANYVKFVGYVPILNVVAACFAVRYSENGSAFRPHNRSWWIFRSVCMIVTGPLLFLVDLTKFLFDRAIAAKYNRQNPGKIEQFNTGHKHTIPPWSLHPVDCIKA